MGAGRLLRPSRSFFFPKAWLVCLFFMQGLLTSCLNPFTARVSYDEYPASPAIQTQSAAQPNEKPKAFLLIHGIYGDTGTFGDLPKLLQKEWPGSTAYPMDYWSSRFLPNFQGLADLGSDFKKRLKEIALRNKGKELVVIAHSQGGLIAREGILQLRTDGEKEILSNLKLILIGSPAKESLYAAYNNLFVNSLFAPVTYAASIFPGSLLRPFGHDKAWVYNRQAYDMSAMLGFGHSKLGVRGGPTPFMEDLILRWGEASSDTEEARPKVYAILGVKNLLNSFDMSDGIVHAHSALFSGVPSNRVYYVPYQHFGGEAYVDRVEHRTFAAIRSIMLDKAPAGRQKLSPYENMPITFALFVEPVRNDDASKAAFPVTIDSLTLKSTERSGGVTSSLAGGNLMFSLGTGVAFLVTYPFMVAQTFVQTPVSLEAEYDESKNKYRPSWRQLAEPYTVLSGVHKGKVRIALRGSGFFEWTQHVNVEFDALDDLADGKPADGKALCDEVESESFSRDMDEPTVSLAKGRKLRLMPNAVNYVKVRAEKHDEAGKYKIVMTTCSGT